MTTLEDIINKVEALNVDDDLDIKYKNNLYKQWIKLVPLEKELLFNEFKLSKEFNKVADVVIDNDKNKKGNKARNTLIKFVPLHEIAWKKECQLIYIFTINKRIVKIGGTRKGLQGRIESYLCGHHIKQRGKSGKCSVTNANIYNTFDFYLQNGYEIEMYAYVLPECKVSLSILDESTDVEAQVYHAYEAKFLKEYKKITGHYPFLSDNADPNYK